jgi:flagellar assembly protein FliH
MTSNNPTFAVLIAEDSAAASASAWLPPMVDGARMTRRQRPTISDLEDIEKIAWEEGFAKGEAAGRAAADAEYQRRAGELDQRARQFDAVLDALSQPLAQMDDEIEQQLVSLAFTIAKHVVRRELRADPAQVIAVIRETVGLLPLAQRNVRVHLHPLDAAVVRERLSEPQAERAWTLVEDPVMSRGGCRVSTDSAQIDARLETRLMSVLNSLMGDARLTDVRGDLGDGIGVNANADKKL